MSQHWPRYAAPLWVMTALCGLWVAHTLEIEQLLAAGALNPGSASLSPFGGVHRYMAGVGVALLVVATLGGLRLWRTWWALCRRLEVTRQHFHRLLRGGAAPEHADAPDAMPSAPARLVSLWLPLAVAQIILYVVQENIERAAVGRPLPGLGVLLGVHWAAVPMHLGVSLLLAFAVLVAAWPMRRKAEAIVTAQRALRTRLRWLFRAKPMAATADWAQHVPSLRDLLGTHLWHRPPPVAAH